MDTPRELDPFQQWLRQRRDELGITSWAELGRRCRLSRQTMTDIATSPGRGMPSGDMIEKLAPGLEMSASELRTTALRLYGLPYQERELAVEGERATLVSVVENELTDEEVSAILALVQRRRGQHSPSPRQRPSIRVP